MNSNKNLESFIGVPQDEILVIREAINNTLMNNPKAGEEGLTFFVMHRENGREWENKYSYSNKEGLQFEQKITNDIKQGENKC